MSKFIDLTGKKFNRLTVNSINGKKETIYFWNCTCDCGKEVIVAGYCLRKGNTKSCGCLKMQMLLERSYKHRMANTRFYKIWKGIFNRCSNPNNYSAKYYGGKGIKCLWSNFAEFKKDMYQDYLNHVEKFGEKQTTIDRANSNGHYCKENCRWATWEEQSTNRRKKRLG